MIRQLVSKRRFTGRCVWCVGVLLLAGTATGRAEPLRLGTDTAEQATAADKDRYDRAFAVFTSEQQPESIPMFTQLIDELRVRANRREDTTRLLAQSVLYRAQARFNLGQSAEADADLRLIREVAPTFRITDPGISARLVERFTALVPQSASLRITVSPADASVLVDGTLVNVRGGDLRVSPGQRTIAVARSGYESDTRQVSVTPGQTLPVDIALRQLPRQRRGEWPPRRVSFAVNRGYHGYEDSSSSSFAFFVYRENGTTTTDYLATYGLKHLDFGGSVRIWGALAVGVNYSILETVSNGAIQSSIPHPFFLNAPRTLVADVPNLTREERTLHVEIRATRGSRRYEAAVFGGPSLFDVRQSIVSNVVFREFTSSVTFTRADTREVREKSILGFNVGADVAVMIVPYVGLGAFARYSQGTVDFANGRDSGTFMAGGFQTGGGLRFRF